VAFIFESTLQTTLELMQLLWREGCDVLNKVTFWHFTTRCKWDSVILYFINCGFAFLTPARKIRPKPKA
jgi:hypothetical protein